MFRHRFQKNEYSRVFYDISTVLTTRIVMGYLTFPFVLLEFNASVRLYLKLFTCLHLVALATIYVLPRFLRGESDPRRSLKSTTASAAAGHEITSEAAKTTANLSNGKDDEKKKNCDIKLSNGFGENGSARDNSEFEAPDFDQECNHRNEAPNSKASEHHLSQKIRNRIDSETRNIEEFIDKTVTGIVELKDDLMRVSDHETYANADNLRKRTGALNGDCKEAETFLRKEINMAVSQKNVLPAVLSNGHGE